jgi:hypothetical protein
LFFSIISAHAEDISLLSTSLIPVKKKILATKSITTMAIKENKPLVIPPALILELPSNKFLGKQFNSSEKTELKNTILEIAQHGLTENDMIYKQYLNESNKSSSLVSLLGNVVALGAGYNRINHSHRDLEHEKYLQEKQYLLRRLTESYINLFEAPQNPKATNKAYELTNELTALVGASTLIEINKLLQRTD